MSARDLFFFFYIYHFIDLTFYSKPQIEATTEHNRLYDYEVISRPSHFQKYTSGVGRVASLLAGSG